MSTAPTDAATTTPPEPNLTPEELIARAIALRPELIEHQADAEARAFYSEEMHQKFLDAGFYRTYVPRRYGGYEFDVRTMTRQRRDLQRVVAGQADAPGGRHVAARQLELQIRFEKGRIASHLALEDTSMIDVDPQPPSTGVAVTVGAATEAARKLPSPSACACASSPNPLCEPLPLSPSWSPQSLSISHSLSGAMKSIIRGSPDSCLPGMIAWPMYQLEYGIPEQ
jgi:hypothetical protein